MDIVKLEINTSPDDNDLRPLFLLQGAADPEHPNKHPGTPPPHPRRPTQF